MGVLNYCYLSNLKPQLLVSVVDKSETGTHGQKCYLQPDPKYVYLELSQDLDSSSKPVEDQRVSTV